ncbi:MAG TPA: inorganic phosphate transporter [Anaerolineales bacterium]|nr:inorganic phosphate transporter [Anaerolineales bacterium]
MSPILIAVVVLGLGFAFLNGMHDSCTVVATMISSRAFSPHVALGATALANFAAPFIFGLAVAETIGNDVVASSSINITVIIASLAGAILWDLLTWYLGLPSSSSHALVGGIIGATIISGGWTAIKVPGLIKILIALFTSPLLGFIFGWIILRTTMILSWDATPKINGLFKHSQIVTGIALALSHGANDTEKTMGIITLGLVTGGYLKVFAVPLWVIIVCATAIATGTAVGGWRLIKTLGGKIFRIRPIDGFTSQLSSAIIIIGASLIGGPVSTTQVVSASIMGAGTAERANKVRWGVAEELGVAWLLTIPATAVVAAGIYWTLIRILR